VPAAARERLRRAVATGSAVVTRLQAVYVDTADDRLAAAAMALRLRKEGRSWVQTLKGRGDGMMQRLEHELRLPPQRGLPVVDTARHAGTAAGARLDALLADGAPLTPVYRSGGAVVEIAFDEGRIVAGALALPVCEIEFELISGPPQALLALAARWVERHGLWLDVRSKSERGHRLARGLGAPPAVRATPLALDAHLTPAAAFSAMLQGALAQWLPNAAEVADGGAEAEHLHQLRVALRRLRSALRLFAGWSAEPMAALALEARLREPFARLGATRDLDALEAGLLPALRAAGGPQLSLPVAAIEDPSAIVREPALTLAALEALRLSLPGQAAALSAVETGPGLQTAARVLMKKSFRRAMSDAGAFETVEVALQHRIRKRLKRLRYGAEFVQPLLPGRDSRRTLALLRKALDRLGDYNDVLVAEHHFTAMLDTDPRAWFALGWLAARRTVLMRAAARALRKLAGAPGFGRRV
jgi:triphosphatase